MRDTHDVFFGLLIVAGVLSAIGLVWSFLSHGKQDTEESTPRERTPLVRNPNVASSTLVVLLKPLFFLSLLAVLGAWTYIEGLPLTGAQRGPILWTAIPTAATFATLAGFGLAIETRKISWGIVALLPWMPHIILFIVYGFMLSH